jgi:Tfp pilus assembly protein PilE
LPLYTQYSQRTYRVELQSDLMNCAQALERHNAINFTYIGTADTDADGISNVDGDNGPIGTDICAARSVVQERYAITVASTVDTFVLTGAPEATGPMDGDGDVTIDQIGNQGWDENDNNVIDTDEDDWAEH